MLDLPTAIVLCALFWGFGVGVGILLDRAYTRSERRWWTRAIRVRDEWIRSLRDSGEFKIRTGAIDPSKEDRNG